MKRMNERKSDDVVLSWSTFAFSVFMNFSVHVILILGPTVETDVRVGLGHK